jgi:hypothetical protein
MQFGFIRIASPKEIIMAIKFQTNIPLTLTFPYGDFKEITGQFGQQFLYTVELAGQRDKLFATPLLHQELQAAGVDPGAVLTISKVEAEGNRKSWLVMSEEPEDKESPSANGRDVKLCVSPESDPTASVNGHHASDNRPDFADMQTLMGNCIRASWEAWRSVDDGDFDFKSEDVRGVGITLFLECARKGVLPQPVEEGLPF